jgi:hypothetical protein
MEAMMARYLSGLAVIAVIVASLAMPAAARDFGGQGSFGGRVPQFSGGRPDAHFFTGRPDGHFFVGHPNEHFFRDRRPIFLDRRRHAFVSPHVVTFDRFGRPFYPYWAWPYWADVPSGWLYGPTQVTAGEPVDTGDTVTPTASRNCRQFHTTMTIEGRSEPVQGRACQWLDGSWHVAP